MLKNPLSLLLPHPAIAAVTIELDERLSVEFATEGAQSLLGGVFPSALRQALHPVDSKKLLRALDSGVTSTFSFPELRFRHSSGHWVRLGVNAVRENESCAMLLIDRTALLESERRLEEVRNRHELVLEGTRLGLWDWNPQTNEVTFDERWAEMLGYRLEEIPFSLDAWESRVHPDDLAGCFEDIGRHMRGEVPFYENVHRMRHKDGSWRYILDRGRIVARDADGRPIRFTGTHTDITAQKEAELRATELAKARTRFLATISHEIRTPLHGMLGIASVLLGREADKSQRELLSVVERSGQTLLVLINDVLDFAKLEEGHVVVEPHAFDVEAALRDVRDLFYERAVAKGIRLRLATPEFEVGHAWGDEHRLKQILNNLVNNAIKFTGEGAVTVGVTRCGQNLAFSVSDTGVGIADTTKVWRAYEQDNPDSSRLYGGTGLGLAIVRLLVDAMGGEASVESALGQGSRFAVTLPMPPCDPLPASPDVVAEPFMLPPMRVLVADDNYVNQLVASILLRDDGHFVQVVDTGRQALRAAIKNRFDLILMDLQMPEMSGDEALVAMRHAGVRARVVAASADAFGETRDRCLDLGFDAFLAKPFGRDELRDELRASWSRARDDGPGNDSDHSMR